MDKDLFGQDDDDEYENNNITDTVIENQTSVDDTNISSVDQTNQDLFGDDDDDNNDNNGGKINNDIQHRDDDDDDNDNDEGDADRDLFGDDNDNTMDLDNVEKIIETIHYGLCIPPTDAKRIVDSSNNLFLRTPNSLEILPNPFDIKTYDSVAEQQTVGSVVTTLVRWRYKVDNDGNIVHDSNGKPIRESNARLVRLTDGGYKLVVGNIIFNVNIQQRDHSYVVSQQKSVSQEDDDHFQDVSCLECIGQLEEEIRVIPTSLNSESHKRVSAKIKTTNSKKKLTNERDSSFSIVLNPQVEQDQRAKLEEEQLRKERKIKEKQVDNNYGFSNTLRRPSMSASYIQENDDLHDDINLSDIKRSSRQKMLKRKSNFSDDDDDEGEDVDNSDDDDEDDEDEDNGEMDDFIVKDGDEDEDDDEDYQQTKFSSKADNNDVDDVDDDVDLMQQQRNKRRKNIVVDSDED